MEPYNGKLQMVDPHRVVVDHRYQRAEKNSLITAISSNPKWEFFGALVLFEREGKPDNFYCADGQQRLRGVLGAEVPPSEVPAVIFTVPALRDEAAIYVQINEFRKALRPLEKHQGKVIAKDAAALAVEKAAQSCGYSIGQSPSARTIEAPAALYYALNSLGEQGVVQLLTVVKDAWPDDKRATSAMFMRTLADIIEEKSSNGGFSRTDLTRKLTKTSPGKIARKAEEIHFDTGKSKGDSMRAAFKALAKV